MSRRAPTRAASLVVAQFARTPNTNALALAKTLVRDGIIDPPPWYDAALDVGPSPTIMKANVPPKLTFEGDALTRAYYARDPTAKFDAIDCSPFAKTHYVRAFALRQLAIMRAKKMNEREALEATRAEAESEREAFAKAKALGAPLSDTDRVLTKAGDGVDEINALEEAQRLEEIAWRARVEEIKAKVAGVGANADVDKPRRRF